MIRELGEASHPQEPQQPQPGPLQLEQHPHPSAMAASFPTERIPNHAELYSCVHVKGIASLGEFTANLKFLLTMANTSLRPRALHVHMQGIFARTDRGVLFAHRRGPGLV